MKTLLAVVASSLLSFAIVWMSVPPSPPRLVEPSEFSLAGAPQNVDGHPVDDWVEVSDYMSRCATQAWVVREPDPRAKGRVVETVVDPLGGLDAAHPEVAGRSFEVTYVPAGTTDPVKVRVRTHIPISVHYSRAMPSRHVRYEVVRPESVE